MKSHLILKTLLFEVSTTLMIVVLFVAMAGPGLCRAQEKSSAQPAGQPTDPDHVLADGIYLVSRWTIDRDDLFPLLENESFYEYDESEFLELDDGNEPEPIKYLTLSTTEFIPFELAEAPAAETQADGRKQIGLVFSNRMSERMKDFSYRFLGRQVATVIDNRVFTLHKIRAVIEGGQLRITRCTDRGCELILTRLADQD